ncbi:unnamed protein product [Chironomus riparius]|uniref:Uncharacterized protein n=1 Tax=Chironomus riparius TaxID=315576 RepID=A0A9N9RY79_9DIPT|nr:unnamed protein product [Chironomus riparius]
METENSQNLNNTINNAKNECEIKLWKKYKESCEIQEKSIYEKYELYHSSPSSHPHYATELENYITYGYNLNYFADYFKTKLEYLKFTEIMDMRQIIFKIECLRHRGCAVSETGDVMTTIPIDDGCKNIISIVNSILNSQAKDCISQKDYEKLEDILTRAIDYDSLNIKFNLTQKDEGLFISIRKLLRNQLLTDEISSFEKATIRKIVNDIQTLIRFEFSSVKCLEDHNMDLNLSNTSIDENGNKKVKLVRNNNIINEVEIEKAIAAQVGMELDEISENLTASIEQE